jgi:hypothetical protein
VLAKCVLPIGILIGVLLSGCGSMQSAVIRSQALSYDDVIEDTTDKLLLLNILRAKDKAPLHFDEIPSIHESLQTTASLQASVPFGGTDTGSNNKPNVRNTIAPGITLQASPTFEIDHLDTQDFVTGIASPIDEKFVKYWLDRGLDKRIVLLLFFSAADVTYVETLSRPGKDGPPETRRRTIRIRNSPREAILTFSDQPPGTDELARCKKHSEFQHYLKLIDSLTTFSAHTYSERRLLAENLDVDSRAVKDLASFAALDPAQFKWSITNSKLTLSTMSAAPKTALCLAGRPAAAGAGPTKSQNPCTRAVVEVSPQSASDTESDEPPTSWPLGDTDASDVKARAEYCDQLLSFVHDSTKMELRLEIRSVGEIIQFLGDLLEYQEALHRFKQMNGAGSVTLNDPVTFGYCTTTEEVRADPACNDRFFAVGRDTANTRFSLTYRGQRYAVANYNNADEGSCTVGQTVAACFPPRDHTLEVLAVVHQLVDLQKSAKDIRETPYVQVLP